MEAIEKRAREVLAHVHEQAGWPGCAKEIMLGENKFDILHDLAISAIISALTPPEGYVLVKKVPTPEMDAAGKQALCDNGVSDVDVSDALVCWAAMLAARPEVPNVND